MWAGECPVSHVLGYNLTDSSAVQIGLRQPNGIEFAINIPASAIDDVVAMLIKAKGELAVPPPITTETQEARLWPIKRAEYGETDQADGRVIRLFVEDGAHLNFGMSRTASVALAEQVLFAEGLATYGSIKLQS